MCTTYNFENNGLIIFRSHTTRSRSHGHILYSYSMGISCFVEDSDDDIKTLLEGCDVPVRSDEEEVMSYFERTKEFWVERSQQYFKNESMKVTKRTIAKFAKELCQEYCE